MLLCFLSFYVHVFGDWYVDLTGEKPGRTEDIREQLLSIYPLNVYMPLEIDTITIKETSYINNYEIYYFEPGDTVPIKLNFLGDAFVSADPLGDKEKNKELIKKRASKLVRLGNRLSPERVIPDSMFLGRIGIIKINHKKRRNRVW